MISERQVSIMALACSVIGLLALLFLASLEEPVFLKISQIENSGSQKIAVKARIISEHSSKNALFLTLYDGNSLKALMFNPSIEALRIAEKGNQVIAVGRIQKSNYGRAFFISELRQNA